MCPRSSISRERRKQWKGINLDEPTTYNLVERLRKRAEIRRQISTRKSVQEGKPDRIADLLEEAALRIETLESTLKGCTPR
jgi:Trm5-related predicted tRNA methylase